MQDDENQSKIIDLQNQIQNVNQQISTFQTKFGMHFHDGNNSQRINLSDILGFIQTVSSVPTRPPTDIYNQIQIYGGNLYVYDTVNKSWNQVGGASSGDMKIVGYNSVPSGWLLCDGSAISRTTYASLFLAIGTIWGSGDGSTTFNLPPGGKALVGYLSGDANFGTVGNILGATDVTLSTSQIPNHAHKMGARGIGYTAENNGGSSTGTNGVFPETVAGASLYENTQLSTGGGSSHTNIQPSMTLYILIKT